MPLPPNELINNGPPIPDAEWAEFISRSGMTGFEGNFGADGGNQVTEHYIVNYADTITALEDLLGTNEIVSNPAGGVMISRVPPANHPIWPFLRCTRVSVKGLKWTGKTTYPPPLGGATSTYQFTVLTALYTQPRYRILTDDDLDAKYPPVSNVRQEQNRWIEYIPQVGVETINRDGGTAFWWGEGPGGAVALGQPITSPQTQNLAKADVVLLQRNVPLYKGFLSSASNYTTADNVDKLVGTVNSATFFGRNPQTMYFAGYRAVPKENWLTPGESGIGDLSFPTLLADIEYAFRWWNPPPFSTTRGWNLAPIPGDSAGRWAAFSSNSAGHLPDTSNAGVAVVKDWANLFTPPG